MKLFKKGVVIFCVFMYFISCKNKDDKSISARDISDAKVISINDKVVVDKIELDTLIKLEATQFLRLQTNKTSLMGDVGYVQKVGNRIVIADYQSSQILVFNDKGYFLKSIGKKGKGPGEYFHFFDVQFDFVNNQILILNNDYRLLRYDLNGNFINEISMSQYMPLAFHPFGKEGIALFSNFDGYTNSKEKNYRIHLLSTNLVKSFLSYKPNEKVLIPITKNQFWFHKNVVRFYETFSPLIYNIKDNKFSVAFRLSFEDRNLSNTALLNSDLAIKEANKIESRSITNIAESDNFLAISFVDKTMSKFALCDKVKGKSLSCSYSEYYIKELDLSIRAAPFAQDDNSMYFVIPAHVVIAAQNELLKRKNLTASELIDNFLSLKINKYDNPILLKVVFKK